MGIRGLVALWIGKIIIMLSRIFGKGGSTLPGKVARRIDSNLLVKLARKTQWNLMVTGTNGKTTTANMISSILRQAGSRVLSNHAGANLVTGITSSFIEQSSWLGGLKADVGVLEVDEASMPRASLEVVPRLAVVTNFFRDQLDRYGELEHTVAFVRKGLAAMAPGGRVVLNADDPLVASLGEGNSQSVIFYGIDDETLGSRETAHAADVKYCVHCGAPYQYTTYYYAHLGKWKCSQCGSARPQPGVVLRRLKWQGQSGSIVEVTTPAGDLEFNLPVAGLYNVYNALGAIATGLSAGVDLENIKLALERFTTSFGRMEVIPVGQNRIVMALVKNPVGFNEVIRTILKDQSDKKVIVCINDKYADGTDISWLWDVDFERLVEHSELNFVIASGTRAQDMALRLKYAGMETPKLFTLNNLEQALDEGLRRLSPGDTLYILPTYTAMLEMRDIIRRRGYVKAFWQARES